MSTQPVITHLVRYSLPAVLAATVLLAGCGTSPTGAPSEGQMLPAPLVDVPASQAHAEVAVLAGGCFWGVFQHVTGVSQALSGYAGGTQTTADYETVSSGATGHA